MKLEIISYELLLGAVYLATIKNGCIINIACSNKWGKMAMFSERAGANKKWTKVRARDLALYTHWPVHTKEFWELLRTE